jgi:hypothetical protein
MEVYCVLYCVSCSERNFFCVSSKSFVICFVSLPLYVKVTFDFLVLWMRAFVIFLLVEVPRA